MNTRWHDRWLVSLCAGLVLVASCVADQPLHAEPMWAQDLEDAKAKAAAADTDLLILFTAEWAAPAVALKRQVFEAPAFEEAAANRFTLVELEHYRDGKIDEATVKLLQHYGKNALPAVVLADPTGRAYASLVGYFGGGPTLFLTHLDWLRQIRHRRDELLAEARGLSGASRAKQLDKALSLLDPALVRADYADLIEEIISLDPDDAAGLKGKYEQAPGASAAGALAYSPDRLSPEQRERWQEIQQLEGEQQRFLSEGDYAEALPRAVQAAEIAAELFGPSHAISAFGLCGVAAVHSMLGNFDEAELLYWRALGSLSKDASSAGNPVTLHSLRNLGLLLTLRSDYEKAEAALRVGTEGSRESLDVAAASQSERQQLAMTRSWRHVLDSYLAVAVQSGQYAQAAYEQVLAWKGIVLARQQALRSVADQPELAPLFAELESVTAELAKVAFSAPDPAQQQRFEQLSQRKDLLEGQLSNKSETFRLARKRVTLADVAGVLPAGFALLDYLEYQRLAADERGTLGVQQRLLAFVVRRGRPVQLVDLGETAVIAAKIDAWREDFGRSAESRDAARQLRELLWQPLQEHLGGAELVLVSPDGAMGRLPLAALPGGQPDRFLIEDLAIAVLPAPRALYTLLGDPPAPREVAQNMLVLGAVDYDVDLAQVVQQANEVERPFGHAVRGDEPLRFSPLAGTMGELATIATMYRDSYGERGITTLRGAAASETALRREAPRHLYLHLATHGFFAPPGVESALRDAAGHLPGLLSGIALAGANQPQADADDGILTAEEVQTLDLRGTQLAVLSACETGLGEVAGGEGLLGLQRAFQVAGAETVIASLWKVPDTATRDLMERFYDNLWDPDKRMTKLEAFREAQLWMLQERGPRGLVDLDRDDSPQRLPPYYWSAFVLSGDWR